MPVRCARWASSPIGSITWQDRHHHRGPYARARPRRVADHGVGGDRQPSRFDVGGGCLVRERRRARTARPLAARAATPASPARQLRSSCRPSWSSCARPGVVGEQAVMCYRSRNTSAQKRIGGRAFISSGHAGFADRCRDCGQGRRPAVWASPRFIHPLTAAISGGYSTRPLMRGS